MTAFNSATAHTAGTLAVIHIIKNKTFMKMKNIFFLAIFLPIMSFGQIDVSLKAITVIGVSFIEVDPDIVVLGMTANETENIRRESDLVITENQIKSFMKSIGQSENNFVIDRYVVNSNVLSSGNRIRLNKSYSIIIDEVSLLDTIITKCYELGMENAYIKYVDHSNMDSLQMELLKRSLQNAQQKALLMVEEFNLSLGPVLSINETYRIVNNQPYSFNFDDYELSEVVITGYGSNRSSSRTSSTLSLNKIQLSKSIIVKFGID